MSRPCPVRVFKSAAWTGDRLPQPAASANIDHRTWGLLNMNSTAEPAMAIPERFSVSPEQFDRIVRSLPTPPDADKVEVLRIMLDYWCEYTLPNHVHMLKKPSDEAIKRLKKASKALLALNASIDVLDGEDVQFGIFSLVMERTGSWRRSDIDKVTDEVLQALALLYSFESSIAQTLKSKRGRPRNNFGYLVVLDLAAIFEWFTGKDATRQVDRENGFEIGPFRTFSETVWYEVFNTARLWFETSFKNWAANKAIEQSKKSNRPSNKPYEASPIVANFFLTVAKR